MKRVIFEDLEVGDEFFTEMDDYSRIARCTKVSDTIAEGVFEGEFFISKTEVVMVEDLV